MKTVVVQIPDKLPMTVACPYRNGKGCQSPFFDQIGNCLAAQEARQAIPHAKRQNWGRMGGRGNKKVKG